MTRLLDGAATLSPLCHMTHLRSIKRSIAWVENPLLSKFVQAVLQLLWKQTHPVCDPTGLRQSCTFTAQLELPQNTELRNGQLIIFSGAEGSVPLCWDHCIYDQAVHAPLIITSQADDRKTFQHQADKHPQPSPPHHTTVGQDPCGTESR